MIACFSLSKRHQIRGVYVNFSCAEMVKFSSYQGLNLRRIPVKKLAGKLFSMLCMLSMVDAAHDASSVSHFSSYFINDSQHRRRRGSTNAKRFRTERDHARIHSTRDLLSPLNDLSFLLPPVMNLDEA